MTLTALKIGRPIGSDEELRAALLAEFEAMPDITSTDRNRISNLLRHWDGRSLQFLARLIRRPR